MGHHEEAVEYYRKSLDTPHNPTMPYVNLANLYVKLERYKDAAEVCQQGLEKNPGNFPLYNTIGFLHLTHQQYELAEQLLQQGLLYSPNFTNVYTIKMVNNLATTYMAQKKYQEAVTLLLNQIRFNPLVPEYYYNLAQAYLAQKEYAQSKAILQKALQQFSSADVFKNLLEEVKKVEKEGTKSEKKEKKK